MRFVFGHGCAVGLALVGFVTMVAGLWGWLDGGSGQSARAAVGLAILAAGLALVKAVEERPERPAPWSLAAVRWPLVALSMGIMLVLVGSYMPGRPVATVGGVMASILAVVVWPLRGPGPVPAEPVGPVFVPSARAVKNVLVRFDEFAAVLPPVKGELAEVRWIRLVGAVNHLRMEGDTTPEPAPAGERGWCPKCRLPCYVFRGRSACCDGVAVRVGGL